MSALFSIMLAVLSVWDYPPRQLAHERLKAQFMEALREGDTITRTETCRKAVEIFPDDPTWRYNLACSLAYYKDPEGAFRELENAIDLGFRDADQIANDGDFKFLEDKRRFNELVEYAREMSNRAILSGPLVFTPATGLFGRAITLGEQNLVWDFEAGAFKVNLALVSASSQGNVGDLYMNRDGAHSMPNLKNWPGLTSIRLDSEGREKKMDIDAPNILFPYPVFGNCSRALTQGPYWRSLPRALMTSQSYRMRTMERFYKSNQIWVYPAVDDYNFSENGKGDVFASVAPYWIAAEGRSWSDLPFLEAALEASRSFPASVKKAIVAKGLLAPTIQVLLRKSIRGVESEEDYLGPKAHPTCFTAKNMDFEKVKNLAASMKIEDIAPVANIALVAPEKVPYTGVLPELTYASNNAWAFVLRSPQKTRSFIVKVNGGADYAFRIVHDNLGAAKVELLGKDTAKITIDSSRMTPTDRVDFAAFAKSKTSSWGAPSFISFAVVDPEAPYSDPVLTALGQPKAQ